MKLHRYFSVGLLSAFSMTVNASQVIRFSSDRASVPLPDSFRVEVAGDDVVATFGPDGDHTLEITLLASLSNPGGSRNLALGFVKSQGEKKGAKVLTDGERATFSEARCEADARRQDVSGDALAGRCRQLRLHHDTHGAIAHVQGTR